MATVTQCSADHQLRRSTSLSAEVRNIAGGLLGEWPFTVRLWDGSELPAARPMSVDAPTVVVRSPRALEYLVRQPNELGLGRAWVSGELDLEGDIERVLTSAHRLRQVQVGRRDRVRALRLAGRLGAISFRPPAPPRCEARVADAGRIHSRGRDRAAISHHYDVPSEFYRLVLGPTMVYSCAYFGSPGDTLEHAQRRKLELICRKLELRSGERMLDVGCGWGSLMIHAARNYGVRALGITLSESQAIEARRRISEAGLGRRCEVRVLDYRDLDDQPFDKVASVGMYEHVGRALLETYVRRLHALTRPGGLILNHGIARLDDAVSSPTSFIRHYVFPDGELHPVSALIDHLHAAGLELRDVESLREHYPLTLRRWLANLAHNRDEAIAVAGAERERVWRLYMAGSAIAFDRGDIGVYQTVAARPGGRSRVARTREQWSAAPPAVRLAAA